MLVITHPCGNTLCALAIYTSHCHYGPSVRISKIYTPYIGIHPCQTFFGVGLHAPAVYSHNVVIMGLQPESMKFLLLLLAFVLANE